MDLELKEVAELLSVSQATLRQWVSEGKVPAYRLNDHYRFSRMEIEDWLLHQKENLPEQGEGEAADLRYSLFKAIHHGDVLKEIEADSKEILIGHCMQQMAARFQLDSDVLTELFVDRERLMPTGLGHGIAVPHTRDFLLDRHFDVILVVYPKKPLHFGSLDGQLVHTCFFLFSCDDRRHLNLLSKIAHLSSSSSAREYLQTQPSKNDLLSYIKTWESHLTS